jgi:hypothetical protein
MRHAALQIRCHVRIRNQAFFFVRPAGFTAALRALVGAFGITAVLARGFFGAAFPVVLPALVDLTALADLGALVVFAVLGVVVFVVFAALAVRGAFALVAGFWALMGVRTAAAAG